jgi:hypothetical protein
MNNLEELSREEIQTCWNKLKAVLVTGKSPYSENYLPFKSDLKVALEEDDLGFEVFERVKVIGGENHFYGLLYGIGRDGINTDEDIQVSYGLKFSKSLSNDEIWDFSHHNFNNELLGRHFMDQAVGYVFFDNTYEWCIYTGWHVRFICGKEWFWSFYYPTKEVEKKETELFKKLLAFDSLYSKPLIVRELVDLYTT